MENSRNKSKLKSNTSGITGVSWDKKRNKWIASVYYKRKRVHIGYFINKEDAIRARIEAETKYYGEFAPQRHLFKEYGIEDDFSKEK